MHNRQKVYMYHQVYDGSYKYRRLKKYIFKRGEIREEEQGEIAILRERERGQVLKVACKSRRGCIAHTRASESAHDFGYNEGGFAFIYKEGKGNYRPIVSP